MERGRSPPRFFTVKLMVTGEENSGYSGSETITMRFSIRSFPATESYNRNRGGKCGRFLIRYSDTYHKIYYSYISGHVSQDIVASLSWHKHVPPSYLRTVSNILIHKKYPSTQRRRLLMLGLLLKYNLWKRNNIVQQ